MTFAEQLKNSRRQAGLSQEQLAEQLGVSRQAITKWETGAGMPEAENLLRLASLWILSFPKAPVNRLRAHFSMKASPNTISTKTNIMI